MPIAAARPLELFLGPAGGLSFEAPAGRRSRRPLAHRPTIGTRSSLSWGAGWTPNGLARDLRPDDALLPTWTSPPLEPDHHLLGRPRAILERSASMPIATAVVRLSDVAPDGTVAQVSAGILNLTHRTATIRPSRSSRADRGGRPSLRSIGYRFAPGHRIRLSIATAYWPVIWPSPYPGELSVQIGRSRLSCPRSRPQPGAPDARLSDRAGRPARGGRGRHRDESARWQISQDVLAGTVTVTTGSGEATTLPDGTQLYSSELLEMTASDADPAHARMRTEVVYRLDQDGRADRRPGRRPGRPRPRRPSAGGRAPDVTLDGPVLPRTEIGSRRSHGGWSDDRTGSARSGRSQSKAERFTESVIREMNRLAVEAGAVSLAQGFPDLPAPIELKEAACRAIDDDVNQYAITWGAAELRRRSRPRPAASTPAGRSIRRPR